MNRLPLAGLLILALTGCNKGGGTQSDAPVPVLSGSASDAMLPLDRLTSQPPLDPTAARAERRPGARSNESAAEPTPAGTASSPAPAAAAAATGSAGAGAVGAGAPAAE